MTTSPVQLSSELLRPRSVEDERIPECAVDVRSYLADCRRLAIAEIRHFVPDDALLGPILYDLMLDYPLREAKGLRPALCIAACRALGGSESAALPTAAVIELYHNAFLVHDDIEDGSGLRRDSPTLHVRHGIPIAINVGDGMLALALTPLLENTRLIGLGKALRILDMVARMARETAEGQAIELDWVRTQTWESSDDDYRRMVVKKTGWYSFIAPIVMGAIVAGATKSQIAELSHFAEELGIAFQIRDDVLNLLADERAYGKERHGDLWEGKRTLILLHMMRSLSDEDRNVARSILARKRPLLETPATLDKNLLDLLVANGDLTSRGRCAIEQSLHIDLSGPLSRKTATDIEFLADKISFHRSIEYAEDICCEHAKKAREYLDGARRWLAPSVHRDLLFSLIDFTIGREY